LARKIAALSPGRPYWDPLVNWLAKKITRDQAVVVALLSTADSFEGEQRFNWE
jgi:hypothetical protein